LLRSELIAREVNWIATPEPTSALRVSARVRYRSPDVDAVVEPLGGDWVRVRFAEPQRAITPGQAVVFYDGDDVVGGGWITSEV
jgi:tRNA-specific 2-thiouridylase